MSTILVVDDDPEFVEITRMILEARGYEVRSASNGEQALQAMRERRPNLVLLDVMMSSILDGLEVSHEMREDPELKSIPVIMVTSIITSPHASLFPTDEFIPIDGWISKPMDPDDLLNKIEKLIGTPSP
ncbi:MAG: response regulator [Anaerolineae bacterium]|nr:response regulator [Anaerolineae bacterium]